jgi:hypothetical protein
MGFIIVLIFCFMLKVIIQCLRMNCNGLLVFSFYATFLSIYSFYRFTYFLSRSYVVQLSCLLYFSVLVFIAFLGMVSFIFHSYYYSKIILI